MLRLDFFSDGWLVSWMGSNRTMISGEGRTSHQKIEIVDWLLHDVVFLGIRNLLTFHFMSQLKHFEYEVPKEFFSSQEVDTQVTRQHSLYSAICILPSSFYCFVVCLSVGSGLLLPTFIKNNNNDTC